MFEHSAAPDVAQLGSGSVETANDVVDRTVQIRCRVLRRIAKAPRKPTANKLAELPISVTSDPDNCDKWLLLLSFPFTCLGVRGQRACWQTTQG